MDLPFSKGSGMIPTMVPDLPGCVTRRPSAPTALERYERARPTQLELLKAGGPHHTPAMPETDSSTVIILLSATLGLTVLLMAMVIGISRRLKRIEKRVAEGSVRVKPPDATPSRAETSAGGAFEMFLKEDPARRGLPKGEQFAAYRRWRHEHGLNWSNS
jgi:hypothetical protein